VFSHKKTTFHCTFSKGPAFIPTVIRSTEEFRDKFGGENEKYYASYAVRNILQNSNTITVVRVGDLGGYEHTGVRLTATSESVANDVTSSFTSSIFLAPSNGAESIDVGSFVSASDGSTFEISGSGIGVVTASFDPTSESYITKVFGTNPLGTKGAYVYSHFESTNSSSFQDISNGELSFGSQTFDFDGGSNDEPVGGSTTFIQSQNVNGTIYDLFKLHRLSTGTDTNTDLKVSIQNVKRPVETGGTYGVFDVVVRSFGDTDTRPSVAETFLGCTLDPSSANFIARKIGDKFLTVDIDGDTTINGSFDNRSEYIRVEMAPNSDALPTTVVPGGFKGYSKPLESELIPELPLLTAGGDVTGSTKTHFGINFDSSLDWKHYLSPLNDTVSTTVTSSNFQLPSDLFSTSATSSTDQSNRRFTIGFQGGFDAGVPNVEKKVGSQVDSSTNVGGLDLTNSTSSGSVAYIRALNAISNPLEYDYNVLTTPGVSQTYGSSVISRAREIVEDRNDVFYIADLGHITDGLDTNLEYASLYDSSFMGTYYPWVQIIDSTTNKPLFVPPSVVMSGVYAFNDSIAAEWFAPAGLNRGGITEAINLYKKLKREDMDRLYNGKVNPIVSFPGQGIVAYGQKTLQTRASALDRINVRRLLINLKKFISSTSRFLVFEQNTSVTRNKFLSLVEPFLDDVQQQQGLFAFRVVVDETVNTPEVIDRNQLIGKIFIQPARAAEFIVLDFNVLPTGAEFPA
jgi:hypothetical protein